MDSGAQASEVSIRKISTKLCMRKFKKPTEAEMIIWEANFKAGTVPPIVLRGIYLLDGLQRLGTAKLLEYKTIKARQVALISLPSHEVDGYVPMYNI